MAVCEKPTQILKYLYIGNSKNAKDKKLLKELNIKYILNCTPKRSNDPEAGCPNYYEKEKIFVYKRIPIFDNKGEDIMQHMETAYKFIEEGKHYGSILVHCRKGVSRSASYVIGYLMSKNELTYNEAVSFVKSLRSIVQPNSSFETQLQAFLPSKMTATNNFSSSSSKYESVDSKASTSSVPAGPSLPSLPEPPSQDDGVSISTSEVICTAEITQSSECSSAHPAKKSKRSQ
jgi:protein-tyrosine phosphatase